MQCGISGSSRAARLQCFSPTPTSSVYLSVSCGPGPWWWTPGPAAGWRQHSGFFLLFPLYILYSGCILSNTTEFCLFFIFSTCDLAFTSVIELDSFPIIHSPRYHLICCPSWRKHDWVNCGLWAEVQLYGQEYRFQLTHHLRTKLTVGFSVVALWNASCCIQTLPPAVLARKTILPWYAPFILGHLKTGRVLKHALSLSTPNSPRAGRAAVLSLALLPALSKWVFLAFFSYCPRKVTLPLLLQELCHFIHKSVSVTSHAADAEV